MKKVSSKQKGSRMPKFKPIPENFFIKRVSAAIMLLLLLIFIGAFISLPSSDNFKGALEKSASQVTRIPFGGENAFIFFILGLFGYVLAFYIIYVSIDFALEGKFKSVFLGARMEKKISNLKNHCIVCGYGRVGKNVANKLIDAGKHVVILEKDSALVHELRTKHYLAVEGTIEEEDLEKAGIKNARYIVTCTGDDGKNLLLIMAAKELNPSVIVASRASDEKIIKKMKYAGANYVIMPELLGGLEIVESILKIDKRRTRDGFYRSH